MRSFGLRYALLAVVLLAVGIGGGYLGAKALDDDDPSPTATGDTTSTSSADGSPTSAPGADAAGTSVVASRLGIVGWWTDGRWVEPLESSPPLADGARFRYVGIDGDRTEAVGGPVVDTCEISEPYPPYVELDPPFDRGGSKDGSRTIAVTGVADPVPREAEALDVKSETYRTAAGEALASEGIEDAKPTITQLYRVDLDGNGGDEVLITVERRNGKELTDAKDGNYSAVILRRLVDGQVRSQVLRHHEASKAGSDQSFAYLELYRVAAVADLNGDGALEVAISSQYYEGSGIEVLADDGKGTLTRAMGTGCGA
ncbi:MAG: hypothetical protein M3Z03_08680 [Actinomycetota bacterium]|nr:hypothetical protein [Actinomycetota bacterium]